MRTPASCETARTSCAGYGLQATSMLHGDEGRDHDQDLSDGSERMVVKHAHGVEVERRIQCPYESQQATPHDGADVGRRPTGES